MSFDVAAAVAKLPESIRPRTVEWYGTLESTNDRAAALLAHGAPGPVLVGAEYQTSGRGRRGSVWQAPVSSCLLFSMGFETRLGGDRLPILSPAAALGVAAAIETATGIATRVKWPNDVMVKRKKVAGILLESSSAPEGTRVVVGVGLNVNVPRGFFEEIGLDRTATSIGAALGDPAPTPRGPLLTKLIAEIVGRTNAVETGAVAEIQAAFDKKSYLRGRHVTIDAAGDRITGVVRGIDLTGDLTLDLNGAARAVPAAHAHIVKVS